ncbi:homeobox protein MOX-2 isoform X1 [Pelodiscus sinensis]|uniref:homeobox protein MOX-2 isoform X1 n=1 Tax=Pelodiscus sinensis TaxID=13735 RepID=UPI003F6C59CF
MPRSQDPRAVPADLSPVSSGEATTCECHYCPLMGGGEGDQVPHVCALLSMDHTATCACVSMCCATPGHVAPAGCHTGVWACYPHMCVKRHDMILTPEWDTAGCLPPRAPSSPAQRQGYLPPHTHTPTLYTAQGHGCSPGAASTSGGSRTSRTWLLFKHISSDGTENCCPRLAEGDWASPTVSPGITDHFSCFSTAIPAASAGRTTPPRTSSRTQGFCRPTHAVEGFQQKHLGALRALHRTLNHWVQKTCSSGGSSLPAVSTCRPWCRACCLLTLQPLLSPQLPLLLPLLFPLPLLPPHPPPSPGTPRPPHPRCWETVGSTRPPTLSPSSPFLPLPPAASSLLPGFPLPSPTLFPSLTSVSSLPSTPKFCSIKRLCCNEHVSFIVQQEGELGRGKWKDMREE